jgi:hypothetical protein
VRQLRKDTYYPDLEAPVPLDDFWHLVLQSVRYCMGRMSYAVGVCCDMVRSYAKHLKPHQVAQIAREIREEVDRAEKDGRTLGMDFDHRAWKELVTWCDAHVEARKGGEG